MIETKNVFKIKRNKIKKSLCVKTRIVIKGFTQMPGVDCTEHHGPVATDVSIRTVIALHFWHDVWMTVGFDAESTFLNGFAGPPQCIEWPDGAVELGFATEEELELCCLKLAGNVHGDVAAALRWFCKFKKMVTERFSKNKCLRQC